MPDLVRLKFPDGTHRDVPWCSDVLPETVQTALLPRMPVTLPEQGWMWGALGRALVRGGSVRLMGPSDHV